jgi:hypothetical protein
MLFDLEVDSKPAGADFEGWRLATSESQQNGMLKH